MITKGFKKEVLKDRYNFGSWKMGEKWFRWSEPLQRKSIWGVSGGTPRKHPGGQAGLVRI